MNISLRKGTTNISVSYKGGGFSNNLYCSNTKFSNDKMKILELDFHSIVKAQIKTNSNDDLNDLKRDLNDLELISFSDKLITEKLIKRLKQNEKILMRFIADEVFEIEMRIKFISNEEFNLER